MKKDNLGIMNLDRIPAEELTQKRYREFFRLRGWGSLSPRRQ